MRAKAPGIAGVLFLTVVPTVSHLLFSPMGFNPTDDGVVLAYSRRILEGQVPHRDFISIRPVGSALLHAPFVLVGGDYTLWISRWFVWFEFACIAWAWTIILGRLTGVRLGAVESFCLSLVSFALSSHTFPIMAWHSVDAVFFVSLGLAACLRGSQLARLLGYGLIGCSYLCRQNFALVPLAAIIVLGDWRRIRHWLTAGIPAIIYLSYCGVTGSLTEVISDLGSRAELLQAGVLPYVCSWPTAWGAALGCCGACLAGGQLRVLGKVRRPELFSMLGLVILAYPALAAMCYLATLRGNPSFLLFGAAIGATVPWLAGRARLTERIGASLLVLVTAWSVSVSLGYNSPALMAGPLAVVLMMCRGGRSGTVDDRVGFGKVGFLLALALAIAASASWVWSRSEHIYRDQASRNLTFRLDGVLRGARLIRTNERTYAFMVDLNAAIEKAHGRRYAILPDVAAYWIKAPQANPLPIDWAGPGELPTGRLVERVTGRLASLRGSLTVIVQKVSADELSAGFVPLPDTRRYAVVQYVRRHFVKTGETRLFEVFE